MYGCVHLQILYIFVACDTIPHHSHVIQCTTCSLDYRGQRFECHQRSDKGLTQDNLRMRKGQMLVGDTLGSVAWNKLLGRVCPIILGMFPYDQEYFVLLCFASWHCKTLCSVSFNFISKKQPHNQTNKQKINKQTNKQSEHLSIGSLPLFLMIGSTDQCVKHEGAFKSVFYCFSVTPLPPPQLSPYKDFKLEWLFIPASEVSRDFRSNSFEYPLNLLWFWS